MSGALATDVRGAPAFTERRPAPTTDMAPKCRNPDHEGRPCTRTLAAYLTRPWSLRCKRCGYENARD